MHLEFDGRLLGLRSRTVAVHSCLGAVQLAGGTFEPRSRLLQDLFKPLRHGISHPAGHLVNPSLADILGLRPAVEHLFTSVRPNLAFVGEPFPFVGDPLSFVGDPLSFVGDPLALVGWPAAFARRPLSFRCGPPTHPGGFLALFSRVLPTRVLAVHFQFAFGCVALGHHTRP